YEIVHRLAQDFPDCRFVLNGGLRSHEAALAQLDGTRLAGVMVGREAYENPWSLAEVDVRYFGESGPVAMREQAVERMQAYLLRAAAAGVPPRAIVRHMLGLFNGLPGARRWRRTLSDSATLAREGERILQAGLEAFSALQPAAST